MKLKDFISQGLHFNQIRTIVNVSNTRSKICSSVQSKASVTVDIEQLEGPHDLCLETLLVQNRMFIISRRIC